MMKKPFGNIGKLKKEKPVDEPGQEEKREPQEGIMQRPPTGKLKLNVDKAKSNIYDAVRKIDESKEQGLGSVHKPTLGFKKNRLLKGDKSEALNIGSEENRQKETEELEESTENPTSNNIPRPTPVFNRNKGKLLIGKSKERPLINEEPEQPIVGQNKNRMAYVNDEEEQPQDNGEELPLSEKLIKPNLFKGINDKKAPKLLNNSPTGPHKQEEKLPNNSEVYQEYGELENKKEKFNFQKMMNVEKAEINLERKVEEISAEKAEKQARRSKELSQLLNLEIDLYEPLVTISSTTPFEVYISKIKAGFLKNSCDEAFDQKNDVQSQTLSYEYVDFSNQCPQDYQIGHGFNSTENQNNNENISESILLLAPVIEELIKPSKQVVMPPTSLLAFTPSFKKFLKCPNPTFVYYSEPYNFSLVAIGEKLYICEDEIECALDLGGSKIAGLKNGRTVLWNGENDRSSNTYAFIKETIQSQNFELPVYITNDCDKLSPYICEGSIVALIQSNEKNCFFSFDSTAKLVKWSIEKSNRKTILLPKESTEFSKIIEKKHLVGLGIKRRNETFYLLTSSGIICWDGQKCTQKLEALAVKDFYLPKRSNLVFSLTEFSTIQIFSTEYHQVLQEININSGENFQELIIPELEHDNREISIFYHVYVVGETGSIYEVKFAEGEVDYKKLSGKKDEEEEEGGSSKRSSNVIYQGVNVLGQRVEKIKLYRDLKCTTETENLTVDLSATVNNLKSIIMKNKEFLSGLMQANMCLV